MSKNTQGGYSNNCPRLLKVILDTRSRTESSISSRINSIIIMILHSSISSSILIHHIYKRNSHNHHNSLRKDNCSPAAAAAPGEIAR
ncbi:MAG TPA: hypothetical protein V6D20_20480 [Candidatus Obscuribacterales bacterium]